MTTYSDQREQIDRGSSKKFPTNYRFSREENSANRLLLDQTLGAEFICSRGRLRTNHALLRSLDSDHLPADQEVNWFAEDLRILRDKPSVDVVLRDIKDENSFASARHTLHIAALFERARIGSVLRFIDARNSAGADFVVMHGGSELPVETKLMRESEISIVFNAAAKQLADAIVDALRNRLENLAAYVVFRDATLPPTIEHVISHITDPTFAVGADRMTPSCRIAVQLLEKNPGMRAQRIVCVLAPFHEKDYLRIQDSARNASRQLRASSAEHQSGIFALGLRDHQSSTVLDFLKHRMQRNRFRGIAAVLLNKRGTHLSEKRRTTLDLLVTSYNNRANTPIPDPLPLMPFDYGDRLLDVDVGVTDQPAYAYAMSQGVVDGSPEGIKLFLPMIRRVANDLLQ